MNKKIANFLRDDIDILKEYEVLDSKGLIKLDAMENPYEHGIKIETNITPGIGCETTLLEDYYGGYVNINRYPDANCDSLRGKLLKKYNLEKKYDCLIGNGSDEIIQLICLSFLKPENKILCPNPSFSMYKKIAQVLKFKFEEVMLLDNFSLDIEQMIKKIREIDPALIFLAYPNNPTGNLWSKDDIVQIIKETNGVVVIDEAYGAFSGESFLGEMNNFDNLLIMKTMSKVGLAGLRLGYLFGESSIIKQINKLRLPFNINSFSQKISELYTGDNDFIDAQTKEIIKSREYMLDSMKKIKNIKVYPSKTNFILFSILKGSADIVFRSLLADKLLVKNMSSTPSLQNCLRVTVGTKEENDIFIQSLKNSIN